MKVLSLIINQKYFDQIISGEKKQESRLVLPTTEKRLVQLDEGNSIPVEYDAIRFYVGYQKNRDSALVKIESAYIEKLFIEDNDNEFYDDEVHFIAQEVIYNLGEVLNSNIHEKSNKK